MYLGIERVVCSLASNGVCCSCSVIHVFRKAELLTRSPAARYRERDAMETETYALQMLGELVMHERISKEDSQLMKRTLRKEPEWKPEFIAACAQKMDAAGYKVAVRKLKALVSDMREEA